MLINSWKIRCSKSLVQSYSIVHLNVIEIINQSPSKVYPSIKGNIPLQQSTNDLTTSRCQSSNHLFAIAHGFKCSGKNKLDSSSICPDTKNKSPACLIMSQCNWSLLIPLLLVKVDWLVKFSSCSDAKKREG